MSGHSHWSSIKHKKAITDAKRGKIFSKLARMISVAAKQGSDPKSNANLRLAIEQARSFNMSSDKIEKAIKKVTGELGGEARLEEVAYEAYGPGGIAIIIEGITDNKNRSLGEIKQILIQNGGKLAETGSVQWLFERKGAIIMEKGLQEQDSKDKENLELKVIEAGAEDFQWRNNLLEIYTKVENLEKVKNILENQGLKIESTSLDWVAKEKIELPEKERKKCQKLFEALDESETVQAIYSNLKS